MSFYDDIDYKTRYEKENNMLHKVNYEDETGKNTNEYFGFYKEFQNMPIKDLKKMLFLNEDEEKHFDFMNNGQEYFTKFYLHKCRLFSTAESRDKRINIILEYIRKYYGVIDEKNFNAILKEIFQLKDDHRPEDYRALMETYFGTYHIDLDNEEDRQNFIKYFFVKTAVKGGNEEHQNPMIGRLAKRLAFSQIGS